MKWKVKLKTGWIERCGNVFIKSHFAWKPTDVGDYKVWLQNYYIVKKIQTKERTIFLPLTHQPLRAIMPGEDIILITHDFIMAKNIMNDESKPTN